MLKIINKTDVYIWVLLPEPPFPQKKRIWGVKMLNWPPEAPAIDLEICMEGLVKLVITSYRPGEMPGGFGETWYNQL